MKYPVQLLFNLLLIALFFSGCSRDDDPAPKPDSYLEYSGKIYELNTAMYFDDGANPGGTYQFAVSLYTPEREELQSMFSGENGNRFKGSLVFLNLLSPVGGQVGEGTYNYSGAQSGTESLTIPSMEIYVELDVAKGSGIIIYPVSGSAKFEKQEQGYLVTFDFLMSNGERVFGRYQGELINAKL